MPELNNTGISKIVTVQLASQDPDPRIMSGLSNLDLDNAKFISRIQIRVMTHADPHHCFPVTQLCRYPSGYICGVMRPSNMRPLQSPYASPVRRDFYYWNVLFRWEGTETFFNESVREGEGQGLHIIQRGE